MAFGSLAPLSGNGLPIEDVIFDIRNQGRAKGINPLNATEGAVPYRGGGGAKIAAPLKRSFVKDAKNNTIIEKLPSGANVAFRIDRAKGGGITSEVLFGNAPGRASTKRGVGVLSQVFSSVENFVKTAAPKQITFIAATPKHQQVYSRLAPEMASRLGGFLQQNGPLFTIRFGAP